LIRLKARTRNQQLSLSIFAILECSGWNIRKLEH